MTILTRENFAKELEAYKGLVLIDLFAEWCGPCKMLAPVIAELEEEYKTVKFAKINVDEERELAELFKVSSIPMIALVKDNTFLDFIVGYMPKDEIKEFINPYL